MLRGIVLQVLAALRRFGKRGLEGTVPFTGVCVVEVACVVKGAVVVAEAEAGEEGGAV